MNTSARHHTAFESLLSCTDGRAGKDAVARCLAADVVLNSPILDETVTGREAVAEILQAVYALGDLTTMWGCALPAADGVQTYGVVVVTALKPSRS